MTQNRESNVAHVVGSGIGAARGDGPGLDGTREQQRTAHADAELHILVTTQFTGSGGVEYTFKFIGLGRFEGVDDELRYAAAQTQTSDERRRGYSEILKLGLVRYVTSTAASVGP